MTFPQQPPLGDVQPPGVLTEDDVWAALKKLEAWLAGATAGCGGLVCVSSPPPRGVQLQRTPGWRLPENTQVVSRPTKYGNPFRLTLYGPTRAVELYLRALLAGSLPVTVEDVRRELRGKNVGCWCRVGAHPCHRDVLLVVANGQSARQTTSSTQFTATPTTPTIERTT